MVAVKNQLKDPSIADFELRRKAEEVSPGKFVWSSVVRSKNSFGAIVPQQFTCKYEGGAVDIQWTQ